MAVDQTPYTNVIADTIARDKGQIFREHPRRVPFLFEGEWYDGIRVASFTEDNEMMRHAFDPDTDSVLKVNFSAFVKEEGGSPVAPTVNDLIRMDNVDWRVEEKIHEADDIRLVLRKVVPAA